MLTRRGFVKGLSATAGTAAGLAGAYAAAAPAPIGGYTPTSPIELIDWWCRTYKILRVHVYGALSTRETLWWEDDSEGYAPWRQLPNMASVHPDAVGASLVPFGSTSSYDVNLGPGAYPAVGSDLHDRARLVTLQHARPQHTIGAAVSLTGVDQGRPGFAGLGARIRSQHLDAAIPASWVLDAVSSPPPLQFASATGNLGAATRPFLLPMGSNAVKSSLNRSSIEHLDGLSGLYANRYDARLTHSTGRVRSDGFDTYNNSFEQLANWEQVHELINDGPSLQSSNNYINSRMVRGIHFGAYLLNEGVRCVDVIAGGNGVGGSVDTHTLSPYAAHATRHNGVLWGAFNALRELVDDGILNLNNTIVVFQTEFGRANLDNDGTEHWSKGYSAFMSSRLFSSRGIAGNINFSSDDRGVTSGGYDPVSLNAALALAAGVDPFGPDMWDINTFPIQPSGGASDAEEDVRDKLLNEVLGVPSLCTNPWLIPGVLSP